MKVLRFLVSLLFPCIGAACIFFPAWMSGILPHVVGGAMIFTGFVHFLTLILAAARRQPISAKPDISYVALILGIIIVLPQTSSLTLIGTVWGLYGIWECCTSLHEGILAISRREPVLGHFGAAALRLGVALLLLLDPSSHFVEHVVVLGFDILIDTCKGPDSEKLRLFAEAVEQIKNDTAELPRVSRGSARPRMHLNDGASVESAPRAEADAERAGEGSEKAAHVCPLYDASACRCRFTGDDDSAGCHCPGAKTG